MTCHQESNFNIARKITKRKLKKELGNFFTSPIGFCLLPETKGTLHAHGQDGECLKWFSKEGQGCHGFLW